MSKEPKDERFIRLAEARVNKIIKMVRLLGNLSGSSNYSYTDSQVEQIYDALQTELDKSRKRFTAAKTGKKRFSLSDSYEPDTPQERYPTIVLALPDGTYLRAKAIDDPNFPAINIYWDKGKASEPELVAFVEHNPERGEGHGEEGSGSGTEGEDENSAPQTDSEVDDKSSESGGGSEGGASGGEDAEGDVMPGGGIAGAGKQKVSRGEKGRIPLKQTAGVSTPTGGTIEHDDDYQREMYDGAAADIERILDKMAEKAACEQLETERIRELNDVAQNISYGNIHEGVNVRVNRIASVDEELVDQYNYISGPLITISRQLQKSLIKQLKENRRGGKQTGLVMGRRLDAHALCRNDGKVFYKNNLPQEIPELAVGLLLDESGSMCSCDRCTYARAAAIILYDFCQSLDIPVTVYGHSTDYHGRGESVELFSYAEFDGYDNDDKYRLMDISARGSNRDGAALRFVAEKLSKRPESVKLLILVSDGQPAADGYYGTAAEEDLRGIKQEYQRKGILFIAAAIGNDKQNIERIYGDSFLDICDLNQLPTKLTNVVKRHVRV